jgi:hypothetical protein
MNTEHKPSAKADELEVVPGFDHDRVEGWVPELAKPEDLRAALEKAFDYRGDVTITRTDNSQITGYVFDRRSGDSLAHSSVRLLLPSGEKLSIPYSDISGLAFSGRDTAAGKSWEAWLRKYWEKRAQGEQNIGIAPEPLE